MTRAAIALASLACIGASKPVLVPDVSDRQVQIIYSFTGADLLLFGAILYPQGRAPDHPADIAVVLKGPTQSVVVREKQKVAGMWINADSERFRSAPAFYAIASSRPLAALIDQRTAAIYELGLDSLQMSPASGSPPDEQARFVDGLVDLKRRAGLYVQDARGVAISDGVLYRAHIAIPARVPVGRYIAETFLIQDGRVVAGAVREVDIGKSGFERFVTLAANRWPVTYGLAAVAISLLIGWGAGLLFRRN
ncbi:TIGR02186 family protein [Sphingomonas abietis]|uniref:TIGR02186 family protein n=1 Tax=Sphingomonas abietis TaxID=3012344 RepID=A0ABY7NLX9_9SPHN|nr:TIGR02186 family protein [Sphingomonas abietis]WBO22523.1 TIGR02186 family protein [Sphingomonas abietis]